jgi:hypothetical protein
MARRAAVPVFASNIKARSYWTMVDFLEWTNTKINFSQLVHGPDEFRLGRTTNGVFSVGSMYKALIHPIQPVLNNKSI